MPLDGFLQRPADIIRLTAGWEGERSADGRPHVSDDVLERIRTATSEDAWATTHKHDYPRQFASGWQQSHPTRVLVGRAVTAQFLPHRPDYDAAVVAAGERSGLQDGDRQNSWVIDALGEGDVMVVDIFGKVVEGTVIGDNLGTAIAARTHAGAVIDGGVRDLAGLQRLEDVNFFYRAADPTPIRNVTLAGLNIPVRIGGATVLPGDVVLGTSTGVHFVPPQLAVELADSAWETASRDAFGKQRLREGRYSSASIDTSPWLDEIEADFQNWRELEGSTR